MTSDEFAILATELVDHLTEVDKILNRCNIPSASQPTRINMFRDLVAEVIDDRSKIPE